MKNEKLNLSLPWNDIESGAREQILNILELDCLESLAIMPDVHQGYDMPIGGVATLKNAISPSFVGYDIGCSVSMRQYCVSLDEILENRTLESLMDEIYERIPVGFNIHKEPFTGMMTEFESYGTDKEFDILEERVNDKCLRSLGSLGSGNHFIELGMNDWGDVAVSVHTGSRNIGHTIADFYMKRGRIFYKGDPDYENYIWDCNYAANWASMNHKVIQDTISNILGLTHEPSINIMSQHNMYELQSPDVWIHRKGATKTDRYSYSLIPANMRDGVYVVRQPMNIDGKWLNSCSHGCGRTMSRAKAKKNISSDMFKTQVDGIVCKTDKSTDEAPSAYKPVGIVLDHQVENNMIEIVDCFKPVMVIKG